MLHTLGSSGIGMVASFQDVVKSIQILTDIGIRIHDTVTDADLRFQIHHYLRLIDLEQYIGHRLIGYIHFDDAPLPFLNLLQTVLFDRYVIVIVHVVDANHFDRRNRLQQFLHQI